MKKTLRDQIDELAAMGVAELEQQHLKLFGEEPASAHRQFLFRKIAWRLQADREGGFPVTQPGYTTVLEICQDATGGRTITFPSNVLFGPLDTNPNKCTVQMLITRSMSAPPYAGAFPLAPAVTF